MEQGYYLAHCISADFALGAGIAKQFDAIYNMNEKLHEFYSVPHHSYSYDKNNIGKALLIDNVFNLVTKPRYYHKPTYETLHSALLDMLNQCQEKMITKIAMPMIGCGLDKLDWSLVKDIIIGTFKDTDIDIVICML